MVFMLDSDTTQKIIDFVKIRPRTIQDIAFHIDKNWRTADAYVKKIENEHGVISTTTFRGGTRGALKIAYYITLSFTGQGVKDKLARRIERSIRKGDFSPFDIYQFVVEKKRNAFLEVQSEYKVTDKQDLVTALRKAKEQVIIFSGNLSWARVRQGDVLILDVFEEIVKRGVRVKILCNVELDSMDNIELLLQFNHKYKKNMVDIRHAEQPLRAFVIDDTMARFKEKKVKTDVYKRATFIFYEIVDVEWIKWIQSVFWNLFRSSISAEKRITDLKSIKNIK